MSKKLLLLFTLLLSAQKFGLVDAPEQLLSETDWDKAKEKSNKREDSKMPCVICKEDFGTQQQVPKCSLGIWIN